jgi:TatA/E family protein of Tat protein translocase
VLNLDPSKLLIIAVVAVILLGPDKLPQVARQVGAAWRSFGEFRTRMESEVRSSIPDLPSSADIARLARSPSALLNHLSAMGPTEEGAEAGSEHGGVAADGAANGSAPTSADPAGNEHSVPGESTPDLTASMPPIPAQPQPTRSPKPGAAPGSASTPGPASAPADPSLN